MKLSELKNYKVVGYPGAAPAAPDTRDALQKGADFAEKYIPGAQIGKAAGNSIHALIEGALTGSMEPIRQANAENNQNFSKVAGDVVNSVATPLTLATGGGGLLKQTAQFAGLGAAATGGSSLAQGNSIQTAGKDALLGGAISAAIPGAAKLVSTAAKGVSQVLPKRLMQSAIGQSKAELVAGKDVSEYALKNWKVGTPDKLIKQANAAIKTLDDQIQHNLANVAPKTARILKSEVVGSVVKRVNDGGGAIQAKEVTDILHNLAPQARALLNRQSMSLTEANSLRRALDKTIGDRGFLTSQLPFNKEVMKAFDDVLREKVKTLAPAGTREMFAEMSKEITLRNAVTKKYAGQASNQVLNAFDIMLAGGGFLGGGPAGALATLGAKKVAQSATGKTLSAVALNQLNQLAPIAAKLAPPEKALLVQVIASLVGQTKEAPTSDQPQPQSPKQSTSTSPKPTTPKYTPQQQAVIDKAKADIKKIDLGAGTPVGGVIKAAPKVGKALANIHPDDLHAMELFITQARKGVDAVTDNVFASAEKLAQRFGISMDRGLRGVANEFENVLRGKKDVPDTVVQPRDLKGRFK